MAGSSEDELEKGKKYLIGSYPLRFDTSAKIAGQLVQIQLDGREPAWLVERNARIASCLDRRRAPRRRPGVRRRRAFGRDGRTAGEGVRRRRAAMRRARLRRPL